MLGLRSSRAASSGLVNRKSFPRMTKEQHDRANAITGQLEKLNDHLRALAKDKERGRKISVRTDYCNTWIGSLSESARNTIQMLVQADLEAQVKALEAEFEAL